IMDMNLFEGMRTLAANVAVEMTETEVGGSHYRVLFLAALVLLMIALLLWQLIEQFHQTQERQRQRSLDYATQLCDRISLNMALNAQIAMNLLEEIKAGEDNPDQATPLSALRSA
ncbi:hypothetical protein, partial [Pseudomonas viridiflava]|uniref:hypothetical protein n=1 Tax=Pseudomonas viridiflava TaxID=33069 RepID=UPI0019675CC2